jgi:hypothetical protein
MEASNAGGHDYMMKEKQDQTKRSVLEDRRAWPKRKGDVEDGKS